MRWLALPPTDEIMFTYLAEHPGTSHSADYWDAFEDIARARYPFRYWLEWTLPSIAKRWYRQLVHDPYWALQHRCNPRHRYHMLRTGLVPGYYDPDTRFLHAIMTEVTRFVDKTATQVDWDANAEHSACWKTLTAAATWWKAYQTRPDPWGEREYTREELLAMHDADERWEEQGTAHLMAVMSVRRGIWYP